MSNAQLPRRTKLAGDTIPAKFWNAVSERGDKTALRQKVLGVWQEMSWRELGGNARRIAMGLASLGFQPGGVASILANTRWEWSAADYGILLAGGVSCGIYPTDAASQVEYLCADSASTFIFVEDDEQLDKLLSVRAGLPQLVKVIVIDTEGLAALDDAQVMSLAALMQAGAAFDTQQPLAFDTLRASRQPADLAVLVYTSGTTGRPKGAMISHRNLVHVIEHFGLALPQDDTDDKMAFLPLCHVVERIAGQLMSMQTGSRMNYVENPETVWENVREISPTVFIGVPRIYEKFHSASTLAMKDSTRLQQRAYAWALDIGFKAAEQQEAGRPLSAALRFSRWLAHTLVLGNVRRFIGVSRMRWAITGAAPISPELIRWYRSLGLTLVEGYGMTESTGGGSLNVPGANRVGSVGQAQAFNEMKISEQGEILIRGANVFMGYLNAPEKTAEVIDAEGWLHTGDVGRIDADGFVKITDRMKDIIITAGGKNITPTELENELKFSPYISDAVVIGDRRPYLTCLVMIDFENVEKHAQDLQVVFTDFASLCRTTEVQALIDAEITRVNAKFAQVEQIKKFRLIDVKLTAEDEELTPTMKLKRKLVNEKYAPLIQKMYA